MGCGAIQLQLYPIPQIIVLSNLGFEIEVQQSVQLRLSADTTINSNHSAALLDCPTAESIRTPRTALFSIDFFTNSPLLYFGHVSNIGLSVAEAYFILHAFNGAY